ncbi:MAG: isoprenylcysteine carboxylmethyltransferase family protein [Synergistaceae bacterium]|jgi:protein-S-isoprenylcysteine O-methyltransferase Ste14|nr:isoprenylcysteine carboxylmethyltransferase family protein [Synergistaceae bacterium]
MRSSLADSLREQAFRLRGGVWTLLFVVIFVLAHPTRSSVLLGLPFVVLGQALRFWAVGCVRRYRGERVGAETLTTWGPYALVRNPLYVGNGLIGFGWGFMAGPAAVVAFATVFFLLYTVLIVPHEEAFLAGKFGTEYERYREATGRFFPRRASLRRNRAGPFDGKVLWVSERHSLLTTVAGTFLIALKGLL